MVFSFNKVCNRLSLITHLTAFFSIFFFLIENVVKSNQLHTPQSVMIFIAKKDFRYTDYVVINTKRLPQQQLLELKNI